MFAINFCYFLLWGIASLVGGDEDIGTRIIGGEPAVEGELPYQISIQREGGHQCGGALIIVEDIQFVITSAQCITPGFDHSYALVGGELTRSVFSGHEQRRQVTSRIVHEDYNLARMMNDIALLVLDQPFELNEWIQPISLPTDGNITEVVVSGRGDLTTSSWELSRRADTLHKVVVPVIDDETCGEIFTIHGPPEMILCAGSLGGGKGICHADLGGPIAAVDGSFLAGIVSGYSPAICALRGRPNINMEMSYFTDWVQQQAKLLSIR